MWLISIIYIDQYFYMYHWQDMSEKQQQQQQQNISMYLIFGQK